MKCFRRFAAATALMAVALLPIACGGGDSTPVIPAEVIKPAEPAQPTGIIRGYVLLKGDWPRAATEKITQDQKTCGDEVALPRIVVGTENGVENTFVFLEGVPSSAGARPAPVTETILIDQKNCQYVPHSLIVPLGSTVDVVNSDPILHNVHGTQDGSNVFNYGQPQQGQRQAIDTGNMDLGIVTLSCEAGHPWMNAFMYVTKDPFVALTDKAGKFVIRDVPPGTYTIKMWHEGVQLKKINKMLQTYEYEDAYEASQEVTVTADGVATVNFELTLRK